jgi:hypothetical protein
MIGTSYGVRGVMFERGVRARSARIFITSLKDYASSHPSNTTRITVVSLTNIIQLYTRTITKINTRTPTQVLLGCDGSVVWKGLYGYNAALTMMGVVVFMGRKNWWKALLGTA